jgi:hypothetical protein
MRCQQFIHIFLFFGVLAMNSYVEAAQHLSVKSGIHGTTQGRGYTYGALYEALSTDGLGFLSEISAGNTDADAYNRRFLSASFGIDLAFSKYLSLVSAITYKHVDSHIESNLAVVDATTQSIGISNGLASRWVMWDRFYVGMDWFTVFTPFATEVSDYTFEERIRISRVEYIRIASSFYRAEANGHATVFSPRFGWTF